MLNFECFFMFFKIFGFRKFSLKVISPNFKIKEMLSPPRDKVKSPIAGTPRDEIEPFRPEWISGCDSEEDLKKHIQEINTRIQRLRYVENRVRQERDAWKKKVGKQKNSIESHTEFAGRCSPTFASPKSQFSLTQCTTDDSEGTIISTGSLISMSHKAYSEVKLNWKKLPQTVFLFIGLRKDNEDGRYKEAIENAEKKFIEIGEYLENEGITVYIEPEKYKEINKFKTYTCQSDLAQIIDFCVVIGGDSTVCHFSNLFPQHCPPVLAFSISSCRFLTTHFINDYKKAIDNTIHQQVYITLRTRLCAQIVKAENRTIPVTIRSDTIDFVYIYYNFIIY